MLPVNLCKRLSLGKVRGHPWTNLGYPEKHQSMSESTFTANLTLSKTPLTGAHHNTSKSVISWANMGHSIMSSLVANDQVRAVPDEMEAMMGKFAADNNINQAQSSTLAAPQSEVVPKPATNWPSIINDNSPENQTNPPAPNIDQKMDKLKEILQDVKATFSENDVTTLCLCLLEISGKTFANGYRITTQANYGASVPDIIVRIFHDKRPLIVIECKGGSVNASAHYSNSLEQIKVYMRSLTFPYGFLVFPERIIFLINSQNPKIKTTWDNEESELDDVIDTIRSLE
ncbi:hypothetical protein CONCODRAFT_13299 [Conidiobolus coronatus NRRL 28638]|uniref:Uncharacterized protein n=1 Tax=Conidiobolus coronatus (strain ATCC 28846 / CBS 209.66 / NRRL 28638) TaxID=796925 RepID=A0A137NR35_CONC2|nr:hypothetical protein CONCODRAFT_13299 [Conidiobolus coronatus NRRL 28638]|eukprot:KXN65201.1 hypothetical protein CONCODRAFT_13299 [Conidiobolus coronatus NRRL 28638]